MGKALADRNGKETRPEWAGDGGSGACAPSGANNARAGRLRVPDAGRHETLSPVRTKASAERESDWCLVLTGGLRAP